MSNLIKSKKAWATIIVLLILSPIFGVVLADIVGYHEPLDLAAEAIGLRDVSEEITWTPFFDYNVPGLPAEIGYIISGAIGVIAITMIGYGILKLAEKRVRRKV
ncbi:MAG: cobalamin biosynthesis protein [Candidatus Nezhaarchaeota archaeon]|nr:cobalamin biosynthesis protein [Candidatus Nezhaarchaeota archaeon]